MATLNSGRVIEESLAAIAAQDYPREKIEVIVADGGSTDQTIAVAKKYGAKVYPNRLKTAEAGKAVAAKKARSELVAIIDSDNILPHRDWFRRMVEPFADPEIVGSEPWEYTWRKKDGFIDRYCALLGMNDPLTYFIGNYDRLSTLSGHWTGMRLIEEDRGRWIKVTLEAGKLPTVGANGAILRREFLKTLGIGDYLFDIDLLAQAAEVEGQIKFAKVKVGIVHLYSGSSLRTFARKQYRRIRDMLYRRSVTDIFVAQRYGDRRYRWDQGSKAGFALAISKFILACLTLVPLIIQSLRGYRRRRDWVWFLHPLLCWITLLVYVRGTIESFFFRGEVSRESYRQ